MNKVTTSLIPDEVIRPIYKVSKNLRRIVNWSHCWNIKLNPSKSKIRVVSRSRTQQPIHQPLKVNVVLVEKEYSLKVLGETLDAKLTNERVIRKTTSRAR